MRPIAVAEALRVVHKGKWAVTIERVIETVSLVPSVIVQPLTLAIVKVADQLDDLDGLHDRFIVASAMVAGHLMGSNGSPSAGTIQLVTADAVIQASGHVPTIW